MTEKFRIVKNKDTKQLILAYFDVVSGRYMKKALTNFSIKRGYGLEIVFVFFKDSLDDYDQAQLPKILDDKHVLIEFDNSDINEIAYLDFATFYKYVADKIKEIVREKPKEKDLLDLLAKVKEGLGV